MTRNRFEFIDDILCGVEATPERVKIARSLLEDDFKKSEKTVQVDNAQYMLLVTSLDALSALIAQAGMDFLQDDPDDGHEKLTLGIALLEKMERAAKKWK